MGAKKGLIHVYTGDGKGKTTAAIGLAVRAAGHGAKVLFIQFFKNDNDPSGEKEVFGSLVKDITLLRSNERHPFFTKDKADEAKIKAAVTKSFGEAVERVSKDGFGMLVLDEVMAAVNGGFLSIDALFDFLDNRPSELEVVLTGREASVELIKRADYVTEMLMIKHPYTNGVKARKGIEY